MNPALVRLSPCLGALIIVQMTAFNVSIDSPPSFISVNNEENFKMPENLLTFKYKHW